MKRQKIFNLLVFFIFLTFIMAAGADYCLSELGSFLVVKDELHPADAIIVLGGDMGRVDQAVQLYKEGFSRFIIMTGSPGRFSTKPEGAGDMKRVAMEAGVPSQRIFLEPKAEHTYQHPLFVKPIMIGHNFKSAIIVSSPYHMRRSEMLFDRVFDKSGIKLIYFPQVNSSFNAQNWWQSKEGRRIVFMEYTKMAVNFWGTRVSNFTCAMIKDFN